MQTHTKLDRLRAHLKRHGKIGPMRALNDLGIYRLSARIYDLRKEGLKIEMRRKRNLTEYRLIA